MFEIQRELSFSASHQLRGYKGNCERLHGHNFKVRVAICAEALNDYGMVIDFHELDELMRSAVQPFDHRHLNDVATFCEKNPTSENIARTVCESIVNAIGDRHLRVRYCDVFETDRSKARYIPPHDTF